MKQLFFMMLLVAFLGCNDKTEDPTPDPDFVYFLIAETDTPPAHGDSYILALKDENHIEQARAIIAGTEPPMIILAEITKKQSINFYSNKDLNKGTEWTWHIAEFLGFYDNTIEIYDGWPEYVEENYDDWVENTRGENGRGVIGFWGYSVKREVALSELE